MLEFWTGLTTARLDRRTYAIWTAVYLVIYAVAVRLLGAAMTWLLPPLWMFFIAAPRLRDVRWSPWLALSPFALGFVGGLASRIMRGAAKINDGQGPLIGWVGVLVGLASIIFMIGLALKPGDTRDRLEAFS